MKIFENISIENYRNVKNAQLEKLKDLNILIGPNNCGKTNILELLSSLRGLGCGNAYPYLCPDCDKSRGEAEGISGIRLSLGLEDIPLKEDRVWRKNIETTLRISLNREQVNSLVPGILGEQEKKRNVWWWTYITMTKTLVRLFSKLESHFKISELYCRRLQKEKERELRFLFRFRPTKFSEQNSSCYKVESARS